MPKINKKCLGKKVSIEILDNYSLLRIFYYLNLRDLANLEQVSTRFRGLALSSFRVYRVISMYDEGIRTLSVAKMISSKVGPGLRELIVEDTFSSEMLETFLNNCPNIEHFVFLSIDIQELGMLRVLDDYVANGDIKIKRIVFQDCSLDDSHDTMFFRHLERATNLEHVSLTCSWEQLTGKWLKFFKNLKTLHLTCFRELDSDIFVYFCQRNRTLTNFSIDTLDRIDEESFKAIVENLTDLRTLIINSLSYWGKDECLSLSLLADLPNLVELELNNCSILAIPLLHRLAHHNRLQKLTWELPDKISIDEKDRIMRAVVMIRGLKSFCYNPNIESEFNDEYLKISPMHNLETLDIEETEVTDDGIYSFILRNPSLKYVSLQFCKNITNNFATMIIPHLQTDFKSLRICADNTSMSKRNTKILLNEK